MCDTGSIVDMHSATAEISEEKRRREKIDKRRNHRAKI